MVNLIRKWEGYNLVQTSKERRSAVSDTIPFQNYCEHSLIDSAIQNLINKFIIDYDFNFFFSPGGSLDEDFYFW